MTKKEMFNKMLTINEINEDGILREFIKHEIELLDARSGALRKPTKTQMANEGIKDTIFEVLKDFGAPMRVKEMLEDDRLSAYSSSKITALLRQMLPGTGDGRIVKTVEKKVSYFWLSPAEEADFEEEE